MQLKRQTKSSGVISCVPTSEDHTHRYQRRPIRQLSNHVTRPVGPHRHKTFKHRINPRNEFIIAITWAFEMVNPPSTLSGDPSTAIRAGGQPRCRFEIVACAVANQVAPNGETRPNVYVCLLSLCRPLESLVDWTSQLTNGPPSAVPTWDDSNTLFS